jgi:phage head maturation protease
MSLAEPGADHHYYAGYVAVWGVPGKKHDARDHALLFERGSVLLEGSAIPDCQLLQDHEEANGLHGRASEGDIALWADDYGLACSFSPQGKGAEAIVDDIWRGAAGLSGGWLIDGYLDQERDGLPVRKVIQARLSEVSVVGLPLQHGTWAWARNALKLPPECQHPAFMWDKGLSWARRQFVARARKSAGPMRPVAKPSAPAVAAGGHSPPVPKQRGPADARSRFLFSARSSWRNCPPQVLARLPEFDALRLRAPRRELHGHATSKNDGRNERGAPGGYTHPRSSGG